MELPPFPILNNFEFPPSLRPFQSLWDMKLYARNHMFSYLSQFLTAQRITDVHGLFLLDYPFATIFYINPNIPLAAECLWLFWCIGALYFFPIEFNIGHLIEFFSSPQAKNNPSWVFLSWLMPEAEWLHLCNSFVSGKPDDQIVFVLHRPYVEIHPKEFAPRPICYVWQMCTADFTHTVEGKRLLLAHLCKKNMIPPPWEPTPLIGSTSISEEVKGKWPQYNECRTSYTVNGMSGLLGQPPNSDSPNEEDSGESWLSDVNINWDGYGLFWEVPFSPQYYAYHPND